MWRACLLLVACVAMVRCYDDGVGWTRTVLACIRSHNNDIVDDVADMDTCKRLCEEQTSFLCRSVEWRNGRCQMTRYGQYTLEAASDYTQPCYNGDDWRYAERIDLPEWTMPVDGCIWYNNVDSSTGVANLEECRELCLRQTFNCVSVDFKDGNCNLQSDYQQTITPSNNYTQPCYNGQPWKYTELQNPNSCVQQWTRTTRACIRGYNDKIIEGVVNVESCKSLCVEETTFQCASIDLKNNRCQLSRYGQFTLPNSVDFTQPCYNNEPWEYAERRDLQHWTKPVPACISGHDSIVHQGVRDLQDCRQLCLQETCLCCVSAEFKDGECRLSEQAQHTLPLSSDFHQPCPDTGFLYTERLGQHSCIFY